MKTYEWTLNNGMVARLEAEYSETVQDKIVNLDGDICNTGKREIVKNGNLTAYLDGKKFDSCRDTNFWSIVDTRTPGFKRIWGIKQIAFNEERAKEIKAFLEQVISEGADPEAEQIRAAEKATRDAERLASAEATVKKAESQKDIPGKEEARRRMKRYNDIHNDGGEGYVPYIISREEYDEALKMIAELKK